MKPLTRRALAWVTLAALLLGVAPVVAYWQLFVRVPGVTPVEAGSLLAAKQAVLVDIRPSAAFASHHPAGAVSWPWPEIRRLAGRQAMPESLRDRELLLLCDTGLSSALAVSRLRQLGVESARSVKGGLVAWQAHGRPPEWALPFRPMPRFEQWLAVVIAFGVKPLYMVLAFFWIVWLWHRPALDLAALRWGLIWFWLGENACSINYLAFDRQSDLWEFLHNYGMAVGFSFVAYAVLEAVDSRLIKLSPQGDRCAALNLCQLCSKLRPVPCGIQRLFRLTLPACAVVALLPLTAPLRVIAYATDILGHPQIYHHPVSCQLFENYYAPSLSLVCFCASWLVLRFKRVNPVPIAKVLFAAGIGPLSFGLLRLFLVATFSDRLVWFDAWEEITELVFIIGVGGALWIFRGALFQWRPVTAGRPLQVGANAP